MKTKAQFLGRKVIQIIEVTILIKHGMKHTEAFKKIAKKHNVKPQTVLSNCTREIGLVGYGRIDRFLEKVKNDEIFEIMKDEILLIKSIM